MIAYNAVYQYVSSGSRIRVVDINFELGLFAYVPLDGDRVLPMVSNCEKFEELVVADELLEIEDPYYEIEISGKYSDTEISQCEERFRLISKYWPSQKEQLINKRGRANFLQKVALLEGVTVPTLMRLLCRFWQQGMRKTAMYTLYSNSGGKGQKRENHSKCGAKRFDGMSGLLINDKIEKIFNKVLRTCYETEKKPSLTRVYYQMINAYFCKSAVIKGEEEKILYDEDHYPTLRQFRYYVSKNIDLAESFIARESETKYNLARRPLSDTAINQIYGPGDCFMIDSTPGDVHLVSKCNTNDGTGRPTIYIIIDVYSRLITGFYAGLENPSWDAVSLALLNMVEDKVEACKSRNITIIDKDWPSHHLPHAIIADRGDMISKRAEGIINGLGVIVQNTAPYRGDLKSVVERFFRTMNSHLRETLPGGIQKDHIQRGDRDPKKEAALTLEECEQIVIQSILLHNCTVIESYPVTPAQIDDKVPSVPVCLWDYGISTRTGSLRVADTEKMSLNVWPHANASLTREGLRFEGMYYGDIRITQRITGLQGTVKMKIVYNPFTTNYIYVLDDTYRKINLLPRSSQFSNMSFSEYKAYRKLEHRNNSEIKRDNIQHRAVFEGMLVDTAKEARKRSEASRDGIKASRTKDIRDKRLREKMDERRNRTMEPVTSEPVKVIPLGKQLTRDYMEQMQDETASIMDELFGDNE